jgi:ketosteroid isomerase-like protein
MRRSILTTGPAHDRAGFGSDNLGTKPHRYDHERVNSVVNGEDVMSESIETVVRSYVGAFARGDLDGAREHLADDIVYHVRGHHSLAGDHQGRDRVLDFFKQRSARTGDTFTYQPHDLLSSANHAVALGTISAQRGGVDHVWNVVTVYHVRGDKVSECWIIDADPDQADRALAD